MFVFCKNVPKECKNVGMMRNHRCGLQCADLSGTVNRSLELMDIIHHNFTVGVTTTTNVGITKKQHWSTLSPFTEFLYYFLDCLHKYCSDPSNFNRGNLDESILQCVNRYLSLTYAPYRYSGTVAPLMFVPYTNSVFYLS